MELCQTLPGGQSCGGQPGAVSYYVVYHFMMDFFEFLYQLGSEIDQEVSMVRESTRPDQSQGGLVSHYYADSTRWIGDC